VRQLAKVVIGVAAVVVVVAAVLTGLRLSDRQAVLPQATCGSAATHFLDAQTQLLAADHGALTCFHTAAVSCRSASIKVVDIGVDTGTDYVFVIEPGGLPCQVTELRQAFSANFGGSHGRVSRVSCRRLAAAASGVDLSCEGQRVLIPAKVSHAGSAGKSRIGPCEHFVGLVCTVQA
jgi:hypothetical protein